MPQSAPSAAVVAANLYKPSLAAPSLERSWRTYSILGPPEAKMRADRRRRHTAGPDRCERQLVQVLPRSCLEAGGFEVTNSLPELLLRVFRALCCESVGKRSPGSSAAPRAKPMTL
jgi:hypothetical protein